MASLFFSCDWTVTRLKRADFLSHIYSLAEKHACIVLPREYKIWKRLSNSCHVVTWVLKAPSYEAVVSCRNELHDYLQFSNCESVSESIFLETEELHANYELSRGFRISFEKMGQYNEAVLQQKSMWCQASWTIRPLTTAQVDIILNTLRDWGYSLRYFEPSRFSYLTDVPPRNLLFFIKAFPVNTIDKFVAQLPPHIKLYLGEWLYESSDEIYIDTLSPEDLNTTIALTSSNVSEFVALTHKYGMT